MQSGTDVLQCSGCAVLTHLIFFFLTASDETKRKMYSSILVVGGGLMFHGAQEFLLHRIINKMPPSFRRLVDNVEVITRPKVTRDMLYIEEE